MSTQTTPNLVVAKPARLLDQLRDRIRLKHYSIHTEQMYRIGCGALFCPRHFVHGERHPAQMETQLEAFLTTPAVHRRRMTANVQ